MRNLTWVEDSEGASYAIVDGDATKAIMLVYGIHFKGDIFELFDQHAYYTTNITGQEVTILEVERES